MSDVASLLLEIETAQKANNVSQSQAQSQFLGSLFDNDDDDIDNLIKSNNNEKTIKTSPDISLCMTGKSCIIHPSKTHSNTNGDLFSIKSITNEEILSDTSDIRHNLSSFDMKEIVSTQQRLETNKYIYSKQWQEDKQWHLRDEKLLLIQENTECTINELQHERYVDLNKNKNKKTDLRVKSVNTEIGYSINYFVPDNLLRPDTKIEHELMEKVAKWVIEKGIQFESMIKIKQTNNPKFAFLTTKHKLHSYYTFLKQRIKTPHLFIQKSEKSDKKVTQKETATVKPIDAATSIASHFLTYYSDDSDNSDASSHHSNSSDKSNKSNNNDNNDNRRKRSYSRSKSRSRSSSRSSTPMKAIKRSGKNSKRRKAMERERRKKRSFSRSRSRSRSWSRRRRSRSRSRDRRYSWSRSRSRSRSRSFSSISSNSSSVDSFYRDRKRKSKRKPSRTRWSDKRRNYRYSRSRSPRYDSYKRDEYSKESKRRYDRNHKHY